MHYQNNKLITCYYLRIWETSSVVLGRKRTSLLPANKKVTISNLSVTTELLKSNCAFSNTLVKIRMTVDTGHLPWIWPGHHLIYRDLPLSHEVMRDVFMPQSSFPGSSLDDRPIRCSYTQSYQAFNSPLTDLSQSTLQDSNTSGSVMVLPGRSSVKKPMSSGVTREKGRRVGAASCPCRCWGRSPDR